MDNRKPFRKPSFSKYREQRTEPDKSEVRKKVEELMDKYNMPEATALQIATGIIPITVWEIEKQQELNSQNAAKTIEKHIARFSNQASLSLEASVAILKGAFSLKEYRDQKIAKMELQSRAEELAKKENIPLHIARCILQGKFTVAQYLQRQTEKQQRQQKAEEMHQAHPEVALGTCYAIVDQNLSIEEYLQQKEENQQKRKEWYKNYLVQHQDENQPLAQYIQRIRSRKINVFLGLFHQKAVVGSIWGHSPYEIKIKDENDQIHTIPKLNIKFFCRLSYAEQVLSGLEVRPEIQQNPELPSPNPYERYEIPPEFLQEGKKIKILLHEGEIFIGTIQWFSKYDIKLTLSFSPKVTVLIFRHAIMEVTAVSDESVLANPEIKA